ncbi:peptidase domain-containing ABC transporter [Cyanobacteria bacterium FACHB-502]|nr:peptidase domain-containing ABC transporter [Cyanobacteria bacterium FACHB-502]
MKHHFIQQHSEEDCGAACLASIARHYGLKMSVREIRSLVGTGQQGTNLWGLQQGAAKLGFSVRPVRVSLEALERLHEIPLPAIIHWKGNHWVVLYGKRGQQFVIVDPAIGVRRLSAQELAAGWTDWVMLLLEPDTAGFQIQSDQPEKEFQRFLQRIWSYRSIVGQALLLNIVIGVLSLASPILLQILTDDVLIREDFRLLNTIAIVVIAMTAISNSLDLVQSNLVTHFAQRLELGMVLEFCQKLLRLPLNYYETRRSGEIMSRLQDIQQLNYLISQVAVNLPSQFFVALISLGLMIFYSWKLSLFAISFALLMTLSVVVFQPTLQRKTQQVLVTDAENQGVLVETFKGALTLKTLGAMPQLWGELQSRFSRLASSNLKSNQISILNNSFSGLVSGVGSIGLLWFGGHLVMNPAENLSIGQLLAFKAMQDNFVQLITTVINFIDEFTRVRAAAQRLAEVTDHPTEDVEDLHKPTATIPADAAIACSNISFDYADRTNLFDHFSVQIPGGQVTALIGQSGCGKSTLVKLIAGLYPLQEGNIRIGSYNQQDISLASLRQQVVLVPQEPHFWNRSILDNFHIAAPEATFDQIVAVCQITGADAFISRLPNKYQTILGEFATNLSGGQRQRLAIARALIHNPSVLILDESTSGLDPAGEAELIDRLLRYRRGKTTVLISHRPSVIRCADWIVLLEQGHVKLQGTCADVLARSGNQLERLYANAVFAS